MNAIKFLALAGAVAALSLASSCNSDNGDYETTQSLASCVNLISGDGGYSYTASTGVGYTINYNYTQSTATITIEGLRLPDGSSYGQVTFSGVPYTVKENGWKVVSVQNVRPTSTTGLAPQFEYFRFALLDRAVESVYFPLLDISYGIGLYTVKSIPSAMLFSGTTNVTMSSGSEYVQPSGSESYYMLSLDFTTNMAALQINNAAFSPDMSSTTMVLKELPFRMEGDEVVFSRSESFNPFTLVGSSSLTLNSEFNISGLTGRANAANYLDLQFDIRFSSASEQGKTHVVASCQEPAI